MDNHRVLRGPRSTYSMEYVTTHVCHAGNMIFHVWNMLHARHTRDVTYSMLRGMWSTQTRVVAPHTKHACQNEVINERYCSYNMIVVFDV